MRALSYQPVEPHEAIPLFFVLLVENTNLPSRERTLTFPPISLLFLLVENTNLPSRGQTLALPPINLFFLLVKNTNLLNVGYMLPVSTKH